MMYLYIYASSHHEVIFRKTQETGKNAGPFGMRMRGTGMGRKFIFIQFCFV